MKTILSILILILCLSAAEAQYISPANVREVAKAGRQYTKIQEAVAGCPNGGMVIVYPGVYAENVVLKANWTVTIVFSPGVFIGVNNGYGLSIPHGANVRIRGDVNYQGTGIVPAIYMWQNGTLDISGSIFSQSENAIRIDSGTVYLQNGTIQTICTALHTTDYGLIVYGGTVNIANCVFYQDPTYPNGNCIWSNAAQNVYVHGSLNANKLKGSTITFIYDFNQYY